MSKDKYCYHINPIKEVRCKGEIQKYKQVRLFNGEFQDSYQRVGICEKCNKTFPVIDLQVDHIYPVCLGGRNKNNLQLLCEWCHNQKTTKDKLVIDILRKLRLYEKWGGCCYLYLTRERIRELYYNFLSLYRRYEDE